MSDAPEGGVERPTTVEYGVNLTLERGSKYIWAGRYLRYWSPAPTSEEEAVEQAREEYDDEIEEIRGVETREVPAPEKWEDDDPRLMTDGGEPEEDPFEDGEMWSAAKRELEERLGDYYDVVDLWLQDDALYHFDGDEERLIAEDVPVFGHGPSGAVCVKREYLPSQEEVDEVVR